MLFTNKNLKFLLNLLFFFILIGCQLQEPKKKHGILFLKNRSDKLTINSTNKNDVLSIVGQPHTVSINDRDEWIYIERVLTRGSYHRLGKSVLKSNNILVLRFDKYGILKTKTFYDKNDKKIIQFSENNTENDITKKSFVQRFLSSLRAKMYKNRN